MPSKEQRELEREVTRIIKDCASKMRAWINVDQGNRWAQIGNVTKKAEQEIHEKIRKLWPNSEA